MTRVLDTSNVDINDLQGGDRLPIVMGKTKFVAVIGYGYSDWAAYFADASWDDDEVAIHGNKLWKDDAEDMFKFLVEAGYKYRS